MRDARRATAKVASAWCRLCEFLQPFISEGLACPFCSLKLCKPEMLRYVLKILAIGCFKSSCWTMLNRVWHGSLFLFHRLDSRLWPQWLRWRPCADSSSHTHTHYITFQYNTLHDSSSHTYVTLHSSTVHCIASRYVLLRYVTWHSITIHIIMHLLHMCTWFV